MESCTAENKTPLTNIQYYTRQPHHPCCYDSTPIYPRFLAYMSSHTLSSHATCPCAPVMCLQIMGLILAYIALMCIVLFAHVLVCSVWLCCDFLSHSSDSFIYDSLIPFSTIHPPHLVHFLILIDVTDTSHFTPIRGPVLLLFIPYYT